MRLKEGFILKNVAGSYIIVPVGGNTVNLNAMITTNETGAYLWELLKKDSTVEELSKKLSGEYDVDLTTAANDTENFIEILKSNDMLEL